MAQDNISLFQKDIEGIRKSNKDNWRELFTEDTYWEMLGAVPPAYQSHGRFACGEPYTHNSKGEPLYYCFVQTGKNMFFGFLGTVKELIETKWPATSVR